MGKPHHTGMDEKKPVAFTLTIAQRHFPVRRRKASPTAIGSMSKGLPDFYLLRAVRFPPARNVDNTTGALPEASMLMTALREYINIYNQTTHHNAN